jgi:hypothetical protein
VLWRASPGLCSLRNCPHPLPLPHFSVSFKATTGDWDFFEKNILMPQLTFCTVISYYFNVFSSVKRVVLIRGGSRIWD